MSKSADAVVNSELQNDLPDLKLRASRGGFTLIVMSMAVPIVVMLNLRYVMASSYVSPLVDQATGAVIALILVASGLTAWLGNMSMKQGNKQTINRFFVITMILGTIATLMALFQLWFHGVDSVGHYGETYLTLTGGMVVYALIGLIALYSGKSKAARVGINENNEFSIGATYKYWIFIVISWVIIYLDLYLF